jgi:hypothetical protein
MRRYRFRLEPVLRVRRQEQDAARGAVLAATVPPRRGRGPRRARPGVRRRHPASPRSAADFVHVQQHRAALGRAVLDQRSRLQEAELRLQQARDRWTRRRSAVGALERLDERSRAEHAARALKERRWSSTTWSSPASGAGGERRRGAGPHRRDPGPLRRAVRARRGVDAGRAGSVADLRRAARRRQGDHLGLHGDRRTDGARRDVPACRPSARAGPPPRTPPASASSRSPSSTSARPTSGAASRPVASTAPD